MGAIGVRMMALSRQILSCSRPISVAEQNLHANFARDHVRNENERTFYTAPEHILLL